MTERTEIQDHRDRDRWVLYDGDCPMCVRLAGRFAAILRRHGFALAPLQSPWVRSGLGSVACEPLDEIFVLSSSGDVYGGAEAVVFLAQRIWWAWPLYAMAKVPGAMPVLKAAYRFIARHRLFLGPCSNRVWRSKAPELHGKLC